MFKERLVNNFLIVSVGVLMCSCTAQTYNFMSPNDTFIDSSRSISARLITGTASKEAQLNIRTYKNLILGVSGFSNFGPKLKNPNVERFSGEALLAYNIPLFKDKSWQISLGAGYSQGDNRVRGATFITSNVDENCKTKYHAYFGQVGLNVSIESKTALKLFLKYNETFFDYYYYSVYHGSAKQTESTYLDFWEFENKRVSIFQFMSIIKRSPSPYFSYFIEAGVSANIPRFNPADYKTHKNTNYNTTKSSNAYIPYYIPFFVRVGLEMNIKRFSIMKNK